MRPVTVEDVARVAHEANRAYCLALGDTSQVPWDEAPEWQRASAAAGIRALIANPGSTPEESHRSWLAEKARDGWVYGPVKDPERRQHPCFRPYEELPPEQRMKDALFLAVGRTLLGITDPRDLLIAWTFRDKIRRDAITVNEADDTASYPSATIEFFQAAKAVVPGVAELAGRVHDHADLAIRGLA